MPSSHRLPEVCRRRPVGGAPSRPGPPSPVAVQLGEADRGRLEALCRKASAAQAAVLRAQVVLAADAGAGVGETARELGTSENTVRLWRGRFAERGMEGLGDLPRPGRPRVFSPLVRAEVKAMACQLPAEAGVPLSRWSRAELAREAADRKIAELSPSTVGRWLRDDPVKPWQHRSWIFPRDPEFAAKASVVLDLYERRYQGEPLGAGDFVLCIDDKPSIQARCRCHPTLPPGVARAMRVEHEYERKGALTYHAAYDTGSGHVVGRCEPDKGIKPFMRLVAQVVAEEPYASARRLFIIVDNGSAHRGKASIKRMKKAFPGGDGRPEVILVHTPVHASWLNQVEIYFSAVQRKALTPNDFADLDALEARLLAFQDRYNKTARPFGWKFTGSDLDDLLARLAAHDPGREPAPT